MADALARAREIAAKLSGSIGGSELGKRKGRWEDDAAGLGSIKKEKIYIPVREHPDINFLGLLIGPRGSTQRQMQENTGAKIFIRGRGSSKDGAGTTGHVDDDDDLHVSVEGPENCVEKAVNEIQQILFNPEQAQKLKQDQLHYLSSMNNGGGESSIYGSGSDGGYQVELRVPNNMVGLVIGKGGENIIRIQTTLQVNCQIAKESDMKPGETLRSIIIKGPPDGVNEAKRRIDEIIAAQVAKMNPTSNNNQKELNMAFVVKLPVPNDKVGIIIGKGGMTIKGIQERTRTNVQIPLGPDEDNPSVRTLSIGGDTKEAVDGCQMEIFMTLQQQQQNAANTYNSSANTMPVIVPDERVGIIIGKGGATVKDIQNRLHVRVQIPQAPDFGSNPPVRTISILGLPDAQAQAKYEIEMIVNGQRQGAGADTGVYGAAYGAGAAWGSYGAAPYYDPYAAAAAAAYNPYGAYYGAAAAGYAAPSPSAAAGTTGASSSTEVPSDPTAYYNDFWQYAAYYGEAAARVYYGAWSPPEGSQPPEGVTVAADPNGGETATAAQSATTAPSSSSAVGDLSTSAPAEADPQAAWEAYKKQYAEWYEAHGKAAGADPEPPAI